MNPQSIAVCPGFTTMQSPPNGWLESTDTAESIFGHLLFVTSLSIDGGMLQITPPATSVEGALRLHAIMRSFDNSQNFSPPEIFLAFQNLDLHLFARQTTFHEKHTAFDPGQSQATLGHFFDSTED